MQNGFNPNLNFYHGITSLSVAVKYHRLEIVQVLIEYRADPVCGVAFMVLILRSKISTEKLI
ncbi:ankyrin repeat domain-containing protein [Leptospira interrogans]|uniref:ankyrin repeat domain-containing protein n=1 Tax=Leptospira interrogans TaxID=173 RepID=UPI0002BD3990|nr:ankyrin repeat domain-containing protein [Leptospira interrogans]EMO01974.1 ankyrin repeat protein [Leptospira interrogans serovar Pomona str. UT364]EMO92483.1 ankyrin repeat protein [Leptospira interrogans str. UI 13372]